MGITCGIVLRRMTPNFIDDELTLVWVMARSRQAIKQQKLYIYLSYYIVVASPS